MTKPTMNEAAARGLDEIVRPVLQAAYAAIRLTYESGSWKHLGYTSFEDWASAQPKPQITRDERREMVLEMRESGGMKQAEIAAALGVDQATVSRDLYANASGEAPDRAQTEEDPDANASDEDDNLIDDTPDPDYADEQYIKALREYIEHLVNVPVPTMGIAPPLVAKRAAIKRTLLAAFNVYLAQYRK